MKLTVRDAIDYILIAKDNKILGVVQEIDLHTLEYKRLIGVNPRPAEEMVQGVPFMGTSFERWEVETGVADFIVVGPVEKILEFAEKYKKGEV